MFQPRNPSTDASLLHFINMDLCPAETQPFYCIWKTWKCIEEVKLCFLNLNYRLNFDKNLNIAMTFDKNHHHLSLKTQNSINSLDWENEFQV